jgi:hypothetical protein
MTMNIPKTEKNIKQMTRKNIFLQTWKTYTGSHLNNKNPTEIKNMIDAAKKYGLRMEVHATTKKTARQLVIWYHAQANRKIRRLAASQTSKCLLKTHNILTVGNTEDLADHKLMNGHHKSWYCDCAACTTIRNTGCEHPSDCIKLANGLIETLPPKWNPTSLTNLAPNHTDNDSDEWIPFSPSLMTAETIKDIFRVFMEGDPSNEIIMNMEPEHGPSTCVATDGSTLGTGTTSARAGAGIFYTEGNPRNTSLRLSLFSKNQRCIRDIREMKFHDTSISSGLGPWQE